MADRNRPPSDVSFKMVSTKSVIRRRITKRSREITTLFLDIGGVLLTDGWQHESRKRAAEAFHLDLSEMEERHHLTFDTYEEGKLNLEEYLGRVVFYKKRPFTQAQFRRFMFAQSKPHPEMIELVRRLKARHRLKIIVVSNEARELNAYRIRKFRLDRFVDLLFPPASSTSASPTRNLPAGTGHRPGAGGGTYISEDPDVRSDRGSWGFEAFSTRITNPLARDWRRWD